MMCEAGLAGGNNGACSGRYVAIDGWVAAPVSLYGTTGTCRSADFARSANRSGSEVPYPGLLPLSCLAAVGGDGARTGRRRVSTWHASAPRLGQGFGEGPDHVFSGPATPPLPSSTLHRLDRCAGYPLLPRAQVALSDVGSIRTPNASREVDCPRAAAAGGCLAPTAPRVIGAARRQTTPQRREEKKGKREQGHPRADRPSNGAGSNRHPGDSFLRIGQTVLRAQSRTVDDMRIPGFPLPTLATLNLQCDSPGVECMSTTLSLSSDRAGTS